MTEVFYTIENPEFPFPGSDHNQLLRSPETLEIIAKAQERYLPWQEFKNKDWASTHKEKIWPLIKLNRQLNNQRTPIFDKDNGQFTFDPSIHTEFLHQVDLELGGNFMGIDHFNEGDKERFIRRNLIEESIASSQLEGANTSRVVAKRMLKEGREARNKSEQMIVNNHNTMRLIEEKLKYEELSLGMLMTLHSHITKDTIEEKHQGVLRETLDDNGNPLVIKPWDQQTIAYVTPKKDFVEEQLPKLISFANDKDKSGFIHPLIKAIMLHFWIGLLHPFEDGNGRLARILFYWYMLKKGYWAFSYLSLSERIIKSPKQYAMAYIYSEQDNNDLNYFIYYNIQKIKLARTHFQEYMKRKIAENRQFSKIIKEGYHLNQRQLNLLQYLAKDEQRFTTLEEHIVVNNNIGKVTAASDLKKLVQDGFLKKVRNGRNIFYYPTPHIHNVFRS